LQVQGIQLRNFRNYEELILDLTPGFNLFYGENGQGKTNLVEAVGYLANLESHRVAGYQSLIREGEESATISATAIFGSRRQDIALELNRAVPNRAWLNGNLRKKLTDLAGVVSVVQFAPEDIDIVRRDPSDRRAFIDGLAVQLSPKLAGTRADYERVLKQRNALLKSARQNPKADLRTLDIWDDQLVALGTDIMIARQSLLIELEQPLRDFYEHLTDKPAEISLLMALSIAGAEDAPATASQGATAPELRDQFLDALAQLRSRELDRGITLAGPHRDELVIQLDGRVAREHASQGEAWSLALGAKLASVNLIREQAGSGDPILILDDVFSVLDPGRRERLVEFVASNQQVLITATSEQGLPAINWAARQLVSGGTLVAQ
jgi:DNA replication and repair protein RecF